MSTVTSNGSPAARGRPLSQFKIHDEGKGKQDTPISNQQKAAVGSLNLIIEPH